MQLHILLTSEVNAKRPLDKVKILMDWGDLQVIFPSKNAKNHFQESHFEDGLHCVVEGETKDICEWLIQFDHFVKGNGSPMMERFKIMHVPEDWKERMDKLDCFKDSNPHDEVMASIVDEMNEEAKQGLEREDIADINDGIDHANGILNRSRPEDEILQCVVCGKKFKRGGDVEWVYHSSRGVVCKKHPGVMEWYNELLKEAESKSFEVITPPNTNREVE